MANNLPQIPQTNKLLLDESPIIAQRALVRALKLEHAIVLQQIHYLLYQKIERLKNCPEEMKRDIRDGYVWVWNSYEQWQSKYFDFFSMRSLQRIFLSLEKQCLLVSGNYNESPLDKKKWYRINYDHPILNLLSNKANKKSNSLLGNIGCPKKDDDAAKLVRSSCLTGTTDNATLAQYNTKNTNIENTTTTTESMSLSESISQKKENEHLRPNTFPVPASSDEMKEIIRDVISITYPYGERIKNINNLIFAMRKKLLNGELNIPEGWADFQKKKKERINFVDQSNLPKRDAIDFEKVKKDFNRLPADARNQYFEAAKKSAKSLASEISESTLQILAMNIWAKEIQRDVKK